MRTVCSEDGIECLADFSPDAHQLEVFLSAVRNSLTGHVRAAERFSFSERLFFVSRAAHILEGYRNGCSDAPVEYAPFPHRSTTDWDEYYSRPYRSASYSRMLVRRRLFSVIRRFASGIDGSVCELGGGGSCFASPLLSEFNVSEYHVYDSNALSLERFIGGGVVTHHADILGALPDMEFDLVFSTGLIEHFSESDTAEMIGAHFRYARPGGLVVMTFPVGTASYRVTRFAAERLGVWRFYDERPQNVAHVVETVKKHGELLHESLARGIFLTQAVVAARRFEL